MIELKSWMERYMDSLNETFGDRIWFVGLQGSYGRGEATENSDIDLVVILDELTAPDIYRYNKMLDTLPNRELICGFLSGKWEILHWDPSDLFQFCHDTTPIKGDLKEVLAQVDQEAVSRAIKMGACNIYHGCVHNILYEKNADILKGLYKAATFVIQAIAYQQTENYFRRQNDLILAVQDSEKTILETFLFLKNGGEVDFARMSEELFYWSGSWIL